MKQILFNTAMVEAIQDGTKSQTRRIIKNEITHELVDEGVISKFGKCPYGRTGDILWVREAWKLLGINEDGEVMIQYKDGTEVEFYPDTMDREDYWNDKCEKLVDIMAKKGKLEVDEENERFTWNTEDVPWKPSIHMPKDVCRIYLRISDIRVEQLNDITILDSQAEGVRATTLCTARDSFEKLWISINGDESWNENPWVWVVEFQRCLKPVNHD